MIRFTEDTRNYLKEHSWDVYMCKNNYVFTFSSEPMNDFNISFALNAAVADVERFLSNETIKNGIAFWARRILDKWIDKDPELLKAYPEIKDITRAIHANSCVFENAAYDLVNILKNDTNLQTC